MNSRDPLFLATARSVLDHLISVARVDHRGIYWSSVPVEQRDLSNPSADQSLFTGTPGIAYFISEYYKATRDEDLRPILIGAANWIAGQLKSLPKNLGLYNGFSGLIWTLAKISTALDEPRYIAAARAALNSHRSVIQSLIRTGPACLSVGFTGMLAALQAVSASNAEAEEENLRSYLAEQLIARAKLSPRGIYWDHFGDTIAPPLSFFTGSAGIQFALREVANLYPQIEWAAVYEAGLAHDDSQFDQRIQNWPDFGNAPYFADRHVQRKLFEAARTKQIAPFLYAGDSVFWNSGTAGILVSRENGRIAFDSAAAASGVERALQRIKRALHEECDSTSCFALADGWGGVAVSLLTYAETGQHEEAKTWALQIGARALAQFRKHNRFPAQGPSGCARLGLLNGEAGHGYLMLMLSGLIARDELLFPSLSSENRPEQTVSLPPHSTLLLRSNFPKLTACINSVDSLPLPQINVEAVAQTLASHLAEVCPAATAVLDYELRRLHRDSTEIVGYYAQTSSTLRTNVHDAWIAQMGDEELLDVQVERSDNVCLEAPSFTVGKDGAVQSLTGQSFFVHRLQAPQTAEIPVPPLIAIMLSLAEQPTTVRDLQAKIVARFPATRGQGPESASTRCMEIVRVGLRNHLLTVHRPPV